MQFVAANTALCFLLQTPPQTTYALSIFFLHWRSNLKLSAKTSSLTHFVGYVVFPVVESTLCSISGREKKWSLEQHEGTAD